MRLLDEEHISDIAVGAAILGSGGGSDPYIGLLMAREAIRQFGPVELIALDELDDDDLVVPAAGMGAPTVIVEKLPAGDDLIRAFHALGKYSGRAPRATMSIESGGMNSIRPIYLAARLSLPVVDCDGMGRAFPEIQMTVLTANGVSASPFAMSDERGNIVLIEAVSNKWFEVFARSCVMRMGAVGSIALYAATVRQLKAAAIQGTITLAEAIGVTGAMPAAKKRIRSMRYARRSVASSPSAARSPMSTGESQRVSPKAARAWLAAAILLENAWRSNFRMNIW